jgi:hypothetical protein
VNNSVSTFCFLSRSIVVFACALIGPQLKAAHHQHTSELDSIRRQHEADMTTAKQEHASALIAAASVSSDAAESQVRWSRCGGIYCKQKHSCSSTHKIQNEWVEYQQNRTLFVLANFRELCPQLIFSTPIALSSDTAASQAASVAANTKLSAAADEIAAARSALVAAQSALDAANAKAAADAVRFASAEQILRERVESAETRAHAAETSAVELRNRCV